MLYILRTFRKMLLEQNKVRTYALYGIGEILLLVIGILLALQINTWNQQRVDAKVENEYLTLLAEELQSNIDFFQSFYLDRYERKVRSLEKVRAHHLGTHEITDSTAFALDVGYGAVFGTRSIFMSRAAYDEILSSGKLSLIRSQVIRKGLIDYYSGIDTYRDYIPSYESNYTYLVNSTRPFDPTTPSEIHPSVVAMMVERTKSREFYHAATAELTYAHQAVRSMQRFKEEAEAIVKMIRETRRSR